MTPEIGGRRGEVGRTGEEVDQGEIAGVTSEVDNAPEFKVHVTPLPPGGCRGFFGFSLVMAWTLHQYSIMNSQASPPQHCPSYSPSTSVCPSPSSPKPRHSTAVHPVHP